MTCSTSLALHTERSMECKFYFINTDTRLSYMCPEGKTCQTSALYTNHVTLGNFSIHIKLPTYTNPDVPTAYKVHTGQIQMGSHLVKFQPIVSHFQFCPLHQVPAYFDLYLPFAVWIFHRETWRTDNYRMQFLSPQDVNGLQFEKCMYIPPRFIMMTQERNAL